MPQPPIPPTPQGPRNTNRGMPLYSQFKGGESDTVREIPPEWRAALDILVVETPVPIDSTVVDLTSGVLAIKREQKVTGESSLRSTATDTELPATLLEYDTDRNKEIVTRTRNFRFIDDLPSIAVPGPLRDVKTRNFGNKHFEETIEDTASLFVHAVYEEEIPNLIPPEFRPLIPTSTHEFTEIGIAADPTLGVGELKVKEEQLDVFVKRETHVSQSTPSLPTTLINFETTEEFGGGVLGKAITLDDDPMVPDTGLLVVNSEAVTLGGGLFLKTSKILNDTAWPVLIEYDQDPETLSLITTTYQVVDASLVTAPSITVGTIKRFKKIDRWRSLKIVEVYSLPASYEEQRFMAHHFPSLWDWTLYNYSTACGPTGPIREGFSSMVQARVVISFTTSKDTITGLTLIPNTHHLVHDIVPAVLNDAGTITYTGTCSGPITLPASSPNYSTYIGSIRGTEQLITGESVLWRAKLYKNTRLYVTML